MAFQGFLVKFGNYILPNKYIALGEYEAIMHVIDLDSYQDSDGNLHRNALEHTRDSVNVTLLEGLTNEEFGTIMNGIRSNYVIAKERKCNVTAWIPEINDYRTAYMYLADPVIKITHIDGNTIYYDEIKLEMTGY